MRKLHLLSLAALTMTISGCGGTTNRGLESVHQPVVSRTDYVFDVANSGGPQSAQRLAAWFDSLKVGYGDQVSIDDPSASSANRNVVAAVANRFGLMLQDTAPVTQGPIAPGMFRVVVSRSKAELPGCPDWSRSSVGNYNSDAPSNYGCATNANLAASIADPNDLIAGSQDSGFDDNARGTAAIRKLKNPK